MRNAILTACGLSVLLISGLRAGEAPKYLWVEGEKPAEQKVQRHPWWYDQANKELLSGGDFISHWSGEQAGEVRYDVEVPSEAAYEFWVRANSASTKLSYKLGEGAWTPIDMESLKHDQVNIAADGKIDVRFLSWAKVDKLKLTAGKHSFAFKFHSDNNKHGMLDCFLLSRVPFVPDGKRKPDEKAAPIQVVSEEGRWAFAAPRDEFKSEALVDLRSLNEQVAGESGYVRRSPDGNGFVRGNGEAIRFWAVNTGANHRANVDLERHARWLAKRGINMVRLHSSIAPDPKKGQKLHEINEKEREATWKAVAAFKKAGIYTTYSPIWMGHTPLNPSMGYLNDGGNNNWGLLFFDDRLQAAYKSWLKALLGEPNPHTGIPLAKDPALAIFQLQNEDSLLFWTQQGIKGEAKQVLRKKFGAFLKEKYGSLEKAAESWGDGAVVAGDQDKPDDFAQGEAALAIVWEMTQRRGSPGLQKRINDQHEFFCKTMHAFNAAMGKYLKEELGCHALVNAGNWRTADNKMLLDGERWSYSANDVQGVNRYYGGAHEGQHAGWAIVNGDKFTDESGLLRPRELPFTLRQVAGAPIIIPESSWVPPLGYQSEGPFLVAAYTAMNGVDAYYWFATDQEDWRDPGSANGFLPSEGKWICTTPMLAGQWPAAALLFRKAYVKPAAEPAVYEERKLEDIWNRSMPLLPEEAGFDPNRDAAYLPPESSVKGIANPLAYLVGPVVVKYDGDPAKSKVIDLASFIDEEKKTVRSSTGELVLDYGQGICTLNSPKAQGVSGFLKKTGAFKLETIELTTANEYATLLAVSLDDKPLAESAKILIQVGTTERPAGWATKPSKVDQGKRDGEEIVSFGKAPWQIVQTDATLTVKNSKLRVAVVCDANFMPLKEMPLEAVADGNKLKLPTDALYVVLKD
ncbi:MAG: hypothetical protein AMXMBFR7_42040 [Planctomycetota bacterium]